MTASAQCPPPATMRDRIAPIGTLVLLIPWWFQLVNGFHGALRYLVLGALLIGIAYAVMTFLTGSRLYRRWRHRRDQQKELAKIDAAIENAVRPIEVSTLEDVRVRIATLEAEETSPDDENVDVARRRELL